MFESLLDWAQTVIGTNQYNASRGQWVERNVVDDNMFIVVQASGGLAPVVDTRKPRFRVILLGRRGRREDAGKLLSDVELLMQASISDFVPCGAANIKALGEPVGPGFTTENRAWVQVDFEVLI